MGRVVLGVFALNRVFVLGFATSLSAMAGAQSMNIDFNWNGVGTVPTSSYGAAGVAGVWNNANVSTNTIVNLSLVDLSGSGTGALLNVASFGGNWTNSGTWTGNDSSLMEDLIGSGAGSIPIQFSGLLNGNYDVILYGMNASGNSTSGFTINNVTQNTGGAWSGSHVAGASYTQFSNVGVSSGSLTIGLVGNNNGIQLRYSPVPEPLTMTALACGLAALGLRRSRRRS